MCRSVTEVVPEFVVDGQQNYASSDWLLAVDKDGALRPTANLRYCYYGFSKFNIVCYKHECLVGHVYVCV